MCVCAPAFVCVCGHTHPSALSHVSEFLCPDRLAQSPPAGKGPGDQEYRRPLRIRAGEGEGNLHLSKPFSHDDPLQDIMCKLCYYVYG